MMREDIKKYFEENPMVIKTIGENSRFEEVSDVMKILYKEQGYDLVKDNKGLYYMKENPLIMKIINDTISKKIVYSYDSKEEIHVRSILHYNEDGNVIGIFKKDSCQLFEYDGTYLEKEHYVSSCDGIGENIKSTEYIYSLNGIYTAYYDNNNLLYRTECNYNTRDDGYLKINIIKLVKDEKYIINKMFIFMNDAYYNNKKIIDKYVKGRYDLFILREGEVLPFKKDFNMYKHKIEYGNICGVDNIKEEIFMINQLAPDEVGYKFKSTLSNNIEIRSKDKITKVINGNMTDIQYISEFNGNTPLHYLSGTGIVSVN